MIFLEVLAFLWIFSLPIDPLTLLLNEILHPQFRVLLCTVMDCLKLQVEELDIDQKHHQHLSVIDYLIPCHTPLTSLVVDGYFTSIVDLGLVEN